MTLPTSGSLSLNQIHIEAGGSSGTTCSFQDTDIRGLTAAAGKTINSTLGTEIDIGDFYGAAGMPSTHTLNNGGYPPPANDPYNKITVSDYIASGGTLIIPGSYDVWSDDTSTPALTIDIPCTIQNHGFIYGAGGDGGGTTNVSTTAPTAADNAGGDGGDAIKINSGVSNVTIINYAADTTTWGVYGQYGGIIGGGGGGGGGASTGPLHGDSDYYTKAGGGGGAGGGNGQSSYRKNDDLFLAGGAGATVPGGAGTDAAYSGGIGYQTGGHQGGGGGISVSANASFGRAVGGGGGGRRTL